MSEQKNRLMMLASLLAFSRKHDWGLVSKPSLREEKKIRETLLLVLVLGLAAALEQK